MHLNGKNRKMSFYGKKLARSEQMDRIFIFFFLKYFGPRELSAPAPGLYTCV